MTFAYTKTCPRCGKDKNVPADFYKHTRAPGGVAYACKECVSQEYKERDENGLTASQRSARRLRLRVLSHYGGSPPRCACPGCTEDKYEFLAIDHIMGGGRRHLLKIKTTSLDRWLFRNGLPDGFRVLCHNCNQSIGSFGYCPHQKRVDVQGISAHKPSAVDRERLLESARSLLSIGVYPTIEILAQETGFKVTSIPYHRLTLISENRWPCRTVRGLTSPDKRFECVYEATDHSIASSIQAYRDVVRKHGVRIDLPTGFEFKLSMFSVDSEVGWATYFGMFGKRVRSLYIMLPPYKDLLTRAHLALEATKS